MLFSKFKVIIIGGGHAGIEASYILSKMKCKTLMITFNKNKIGELSCNPSIGGLGKSNLVKEIDALGGLMGKIVDLSGINYKILNTSKGYAVRATRVQVDKEIYKNSIISYLCKYKKYLTILEDEVNYLIIKKNIVYGVNTKNYGNIYCKIVLLCVGTFLDSKIFIGKRVFRGGRINDFSSINLANFLKSIKLKFGYLKTGTPPRLDKNTINFKNFVKQISNYNIISKFSFFNTLRKKKYLIQKKCYLTYTNDLTNNIVKKNLHLSPLFNGLIISKGPRYCPSLEDKVNNFFRDRHNIFLEPENINSNIIYPNGISMSLPIKIQYEVINSIEGMHNTKILIPGYSVEYMYLDPIFLNKNLESKLINNLFIAGQINGTTGYEEAASQGLMAGINIYLKINDKSPLILNRLNSYIGVLIDDICTKGIKEPYRIFNSRSEFSLFLREDNADYRLISFSKKLKLISKKKCFFLENKIKEIKLIYNYLKKKNFYLDNIPNFIKKYFKNKHVITSKSLICNPSIRFSKIKNFLFKNNKYFLKSKFLKEIKILFIYKGYLKRQKLEINKYKFYENIILPHNINYKNIIGLSNEVIDILNYYKPNFLGQLLRMSGITPISLFIVFNYLKKNKLLYFNN